MTHILILEDDPDRRRWFTERFPGCLMVSTVEEALAYLAREKVTVLFLDHDLGTEPRVGRDVGAWLIAHPEMAVDLMTIVHSENEVSAGKITRELRAAGRAVLRIPFSTIKGCA